MFLRVLQGPYIGELREFPTLIGKNLISKKFAEVPTPKEVEEWEAAMEQSEPPPEPRVLKQQRQAQQRAAR
jgi:hypothetical protein